MPLEKARDIMIPLEQYAVVDEDATLVEALQALDDAQDLVPEGMHPHRAVLVRDRSGAITGKLGHHAFLAGLEPRYLDHLDRTPQVYEGYSKEFLRGIMEQTAFWQHDFDTYVRRAMKTRVGDAMHPLAEHIDIDASIGQVIHKLIVCNALSLLVTEGERPVGMLRMADVFTVVAKNIKRRAGMVTTTPGK